MARPIASPLPFLCATVFFVAAGCQTRQEGSPRDTRNPAESSETKPAADPAPLSVEEPPPLPRDRVLALLKYAPGRTEGVFLVYARRMLKDPQLYSRAEVVLSALGSSPELTRLKSAGLDPLKNIEGLCLLVMPKAPGATGSASEALLAITGDFDAAKIAAAMVGGGKDVFEAVDSDVLFFGPAPLISEAKSAAKKSRPLADSPDLSAAFSGADASRPVYGAFFQPPGRRTGPSIEGRFHQWTAWLDLSRGLELEVDILYADAAEAATASSNMERSTRSVLTSLEPALKGMGLPGGIPLSSALGFRTSGSRVIISFRLDETQMAGLFAAFSRMFPYMTSKAPSPAPPPPIPPPPPPSLPH